MTDFAPHAMPRRRAVLMEQARVIGLSMRWPATVAALLFGLATLAIARELLSDGQPIAFHPEQFMLPGVVALLLPIGVWKGEKHFGNGHLWTLPVDRREHALARVVAGWAWLMAAVALFVLVQLIISLVSGQNILQEESLRMISADSAPATRTIDPVALQALPVVRWSPEPLLWLAPFTAATGMYLFASAVALGTRYPLRWILGIGLGVFVVLFAGDVANAEWLMHAPDRLMRPLFLGPYGLDAMLTARTEFLKVGTILTNGESAVVWRGVPDVGQWAAATLLWTTAGALALWAAASRHRERRRG